MTEETQNPQTAPSQHKYFEKYLAKLSNVIAFDKRKNI